MGQSSRFNTNLKPICSLFRPEMKPALLVQRNFDVLSANAPPLTTREDPFP